MSELRRERRAERERGTSVSHVRRHVQFQERGAEAGGRGGVWSAATAGGDGRSREYGTEKGYAIAIDLTADQTGNVEAPIQLFTLRGGDFINNHYLGVGGADGLTSGPVSSPVSGSKLINWGYAGVGVFNPYRSFIAREL